jgi:N-terminal domain of toast_rack, DUF2154
MIKKITITSLLLILALSACTFNISLPINTKTGPTQVDDIILPVPADAEKVTLSLSFGAGILKLHPGTDSLISGTATYNIEDFKPSLTVTGSVVTLEQGEWKVEGIPDVRDIKNEWDLSLGSFPMDLSIDAGAYQGRFEFGGLSLSNLSVSDGAADVEMAFSEPNNAEMTLFQYQTGASNVSLSGLGYANFGTMEFDSGAGNYTLDFSGSLKRDASVSIETGVSNMTLVIPAGVPARITVDGGLSNISYGSGWMKDSNVYTQEGTGPSLTILIEIGAGNLTITR